MEPGSISVEAQVPSAWFWIETFQIQKLDIWSIQLTRNELLVLTGNPNEMIIIKESVCWQAVCLSIEQFDNWNQVAHDDRGKNTLLVTFAAS